MRRAFIGLFVFMSIFALQKQTIMANDQMELSPSERMDLYLRYSDELVPWYYLAAIDQYERNIQQVRKDIEKSDGPLALRFTDEDWIGAVNPDAENNSIESITYFGGIGMDGDGDGIADKSNSDDLLLTLHSVLSANGSSENDFKIALEQLYEKESTVNQIMAIATLYSRFETIELDEHRFPIPKGYNYTYRSTWGASRGWGGRRIHEGTDIFAGYSTPVMSASYGVIEVMGWNNFGGWRIGIRDNHNTYHYYAHLAYFNKEIKEGDVVEPGTVIGFVGSSGYGKEGTSGKFPPHLHYGVYKYNGRTEWAFDPFPSLSLWERQDRKKGR
ncbi:L-Ala--D-Glu endopeptidase [Sporosarcina sp. NCCP-2222]|uniref:M23 family metallopeptidase n=1 Tax=Sporosarcina sp. NCCP-2222 TaxID=2935073 RepID=UPI00208C72DC|nr:M23 family metallopeptidase [Sporosarcina sp. NCCP-2222]GKV54747.1 L-Ala--D-Glu endopeptidase [Sporosarcina sp. NCCP-2222]